MSELLPCPFCGSEAALWGRNCEKDSPYNPLDRAYPVVRCIKCHAEVAGEDWRGTETAAKKWNSRANQAEAL